MGGASLFLSPGRKDRERERETSKTARRVAGAVEGARCKFIPLEVWCDATWRAYIARSSSPLRLAATA